jgi:uncharacterized protein YjbI with pentapeptide repeats
MTTEELYSQLDKVREKFLAQQPKHNNVPLFTSESVRAYLDKVNAMIAGRQLDPNRPALVFKGCAFNFPEWPPGDYPGLELSGDAYFLGNPGGHLDRHFADIRIIGPLIINVAIHEPGDVVLRNVKVEGPLRLEINITQGNMSLQQLICSGPASIVGSHIKNIADCVFRKDVRWRSNNFSKADGASAVEMRKVQYDADCVFDSVGFESIFDCKGTKFRGRAVFDSMVFPKGADFQEVTFDDASFRGAQFGSRALFTGAIFRGADFSNAKFSDTTEFSRAKFERAPLFHGATLHPDTVFDRTKFIGHRHPSDWAAYRTLREMMGKLGAGAEESEFFVHEQRAQVWREMKRFGAWPSVLSSLLYWAFSRYGHSIARPLAWLVVLNYGFSVLYGCLGGISVAADYAGHWPRGMSPAIGLMWQNLINPLGFLGKVTPYQIDSLVIAGWSVAQSLLSVLLLTLLALAVRRRFRKTAE